MGKLKDCEVLWPIQGHKSSEWLSQKNKTKQTLCPENLILEFYQGHWLDQIQPWTVLANGYAVLPNECGVTFIPSIATHFVCSSASSPHKDLLFPYQIFLFPGFWELLSVLLCFSAHIYKASKYLLQLNSTFPRQILHHLTYIHGT